MDDPKKHRRRYLQFSLRTLLILVTLAVGLLVAWRTYVEPYRQQRETMKLIKELGGRYETKPGGSEWMREWFGADNFQDITFVDLADCDDPQAYLDSIAALPRLETLVVGGRKFGDEHLTRLMGLANLRASILDSTSVTDGHITSLKRTLPELVARRSQRRAIDAVQRLGGELATKLCGMSPELRRRVGNEHFQDATSINLSSVPLVVRDADLAYLAALTSLKVLDLTSIPVGDAGMVHLSGLTNLQTLSIADTLVTDAGLTHLAGLTKLEDLDLSYTHVGDTGLAHLKGLVNMKTLFLTNTKVTDTGLAFLERLTHLQELWLRDTKVTDAGLVNLEGLTNVQELILSGTRVSDAGLAKLKGLTNLEGLFVDGTQVSDAGLAHITDLTNLGALDLSRTQVSDAGSVHLNGLRTLRLLFLLATRVSDAGAEELKSALPNCRVIR